MAQVDTGGLVARVDGGFQLLRLGHRFGRQLGHLLRLVVADLRRLVGDDQLVAAYLHAGRDAVVAS